MRRDSALLNDVIAACDRIADVVGKSSEEEFLLDAVRQAAVLHHLTVIGEAIGRLSPEIKGRYPDVPWKELTSIRNRIVHAYFDLDWQILWVSATEEAPELRARVVDVLRIEGRE